jgi:hypothetical protein
MDESDPNQGSRRAKSASPRMQPLRVTTPTGPVSLETIGDLIAFIKDHDSRWRKLREYAFIAAAMPSPALIAHARSLAVTAFREAGVLVE